MPGAAGPAPAAPLPPPTPAGYALPVTPSLVAANPKLIGEGNPAPRRTEPAGPVTIPVPAETGVDAVTAGTVKVIRAANGRPVIVLSGADGATYTYGNVTPAAALTAKATPATHTQATHMLAGDRIGRAGPGGLTFTVSVPDVRGPVDAQAALQAWAAGLSVNVRALPSSIASATAAPALGQVLLVTDSGARATGAGVARSMSGSLVRARTRTVADPRTVRHHDPVADQIVSWTPHEQVVVILADGTPAQAAAIAGRLPSGRQVLWVAPPGTTAKQAAAYRAIVAAHPGFRVESLPSAAGAKPAGALATATLTAAYTASAYRLNSPATQASAVLSWAEQHLGQHCDRAAAALTGFDCSGLTMNALAQAGITVPHDASGQWGQTKAHPVAASHLAPGDLVFFSGADAGAAPGRVGIYVGDGQVIDAPGPGSAVRFDPVTGIAGYTGATDPFTLVPGIANSGSGSGSLGPAPGTPAAPGTLSQYQSFAQRLADSTWGAGQFSFLYMLWERESGWNPAALNPMSGAYGIPQSLPATKMATAGLDWATNAYTQIVWGIGYISAAYGTPQAAWAHEVAYGWY